MLTVTLPNKWKPRDYQMPLWTYLERGGKRAIYTWHRRAGKDDVALHHTATSIFKRPGTYWYLLPQAEQARKAIWTAIDPHTGLKRIDWAFPQATRKITRNNEMYIEFLNGATWQVVGSDNYNSLVGSPPVGVVLSEYALSNPQAWSYLRPILRENGGWAIFNFTPRGRNHAARMFDGAKNDNDWFAQKLTAYETNVFSKDDLEKERAELIRDMGEDDGDSRFRQEYLCDFAADLVGAFYGKQITQLEDAGRIKLVDHDPSLPVETAWDLGKTDDTVIWFYQRAAWEIRVIDYYAANGHGVDHYAGVLSQKRSRLNRPYEYSKHWLPWDAVPETMAASKSILRQLADFQGIDKVKLVPNLKVEDGIQATRAILPRCWFDAERCAAGVEALRAYQREYDEERKVFMPKPMHNWASHPADAFRMLAVAYQESQGEKPREVFRNPTWDEVMQGQTARYSEARIA